MGKNTTEIKATVMSQTAESLAQLCANTGLSTGEVIDRLTMNMRPKEKELAVTMAFQEIIMILSALPEEENNAAFLDLITTLMVMVPGEFEDSLIKEAEEKRENLQKNLGSLSPEELERLGERLIGDIEDLLDPQE